MRSGAGWAGTFGELVRAKPNEVVSHLERFVLAELGLPVGDAQRTAWADSVRELHAELGAAVLRRPDAAEWGVILEYELPRQRGRRPDILLLCPGFVLVVEAKSWAAPQPADRDQVLGYVRDLSHYHSVGQTAHLEPVLLMLGARGWAARQGGLDVVGAGGLAELLCAIPPDAEPVRTETWMAGDYEPLPSLVAARLVFEHEPLPHIRAAQSAGISQALARLEQTADHLGRP